ncbi:MAG: WD40-like Beta Propeller Repeat protein [Phycisphaerales bacterium]|nr:WD40-like Beta Propeller Repeat protein [Phycisphaerales bacterium]
MDAETNGPKRRWPGRIAIFIVLLLIAAGGWWVANRKVWTDDRTIHVASSQAKVREVLWDAPKPLGPQFDSDSQQYEPSVSPDGTELYFVRGKPGKNADIYVSYRRNNAWTTPEPLTAVNSPYDDLGPRVSADGKLLFFYSDRPSGFGGYDIWASPRTAEGWGAPINLGPTVNSEFNEFTPDPTPDGKHLIFATNRTAAKREQAEPWRATIRENGAGDYDLWIADLDEAKSRPAEAASPATQLERDTGVPPVPGAPNVGELEGPQSPRSQHGRDARVTSEDSHPTTQPVPTVGPTTRQVLDSVRADVEEFVHPTTAPATQPAVQALFFQPAREIPGINTTFVEGASCMSPAGDFLYFCSNRPGGFGKFDIWRSRVSPEWKFSVPENLGPEINTADNETDPALALNGYRLVFSSDRGPAGGRYALFSSDSREVYSLHQGPRLPQASLNLWLLIASIILLVPLLLFLKGWDDRHMGLLQKCLLISLLVHVLLTFVLSFLSVVAKNYPQVGKDLGIEAVVSLVAPRDVEIGVEIRRQSTSDLPTAGAPPAAQRQTNAPLETAIVPGPVDVTIPQTHVTPGPVALTFEPPKAVPSSVKAEWVAPAPVAPRNDVLDVRVRAPQAVSQEEAAPKVAAVAPSIDRVMPNIPQFSPQAVKTDAAPAVRPDTSASAPPTVPGPSMKPNLPSEQQTVKTEVAADIAPDLTVKGPQVQSRQVSAPAPDISTSADVQPKLDRQQAASAANIPAEIGNTPGIPKASADASSLAPAPTAAANIGINSPADMLPAPTVATGAEGPSVAIMPAPARAVAPENSAALAGAGESKAASPGPLSTTGQSAAQLGPIQIATATAPIRPGAEPTPQRGIAAAGSFKSPVMPTTLPADAVAAATGAAFDGPSVGLIVPPQAQRHSAADPQIATAISVGSGPATRPADTIAVGSNQPSAGNPVQIAMATGAAKPDEVSSLVSAPAVGPRIGAPLPATPQAAPSAAAAIPGALEGPQIALHLPAAQVAVGGGTPGSGVDVPASPEITAFSSRQALHGTEGGGASKNVYNDVAAPVAPGGTRPGIGAGKGPDLVPVHPRPTQFTSASPDISISPLPGDLGPGRLAAPDSPFHMRAPEVRKPLIEQIGGTKESENAVDRGLAWLASVQDDDGHWGYIPDESRARRRQRSQHDMGLTGLSTLAFLAQDHRPDKAGPYRQTVGRSLDYLLSQQLPDGDLRGPTPGGSSDQANLYDHGIATLAIGEAALMTRDPRYVEATLRAARFIVAAQDDATGGWRYLPKQAGDSSVFGWQVMALHSAEQLGFEIPDSTRRGMLKFLDITSSGRHHMLAGYLPRGAPTATMTSQIVFSRMLLGQQLNEAEIKEAGDFLRRQPPDPNDADIYYWYYASLSMQQMQTPTWKAWNEQTRDLLIRMQHKDGDHAGYWDTNVRRGDRGGRVFTTSIATLTLEVYYRYMPMQKVAEQQLPNVAPVQPKPTDVADDRVLRPADQRKPQRDKRYLEPN